MIMISLFKSLKKRGSNSSFECEHSMENKVIVVTVSSFCPTNALSYSSDKMTVLFQDSKNYSDIFKMASE